MRGCHNCPVADEIANGKYANTNWNDIPCAICDAADSGGYAVEYNDAIAGPPSTGGTGETGVDVLPLDVMRQMCEGLMTLPRDLRDVVAMRSTGIRYGEIAERQGVTTSCVEKRHRRALEIWPALREMFPVKIAKQQRRKRKAPSGGRKGAVSRGGRVRNRG